MPAVGETITVEGLTALTRAFKAADDVLAKELRVALREASEPVRATAESLAVQGIPRIGIPWSRMRIGVTSTSVYVAPRERSRSRLAQRKRPNLAELLLGRSMEPALAQNEPEVMARLDKVLGTVGRAWGSV